MDGNGLVERLFSKFHSSTLYLKNEDQCLFSNYSPVAVLPCFSKILETIMYKRLINFIQKYDILYNKQFGFRKNHSTETAIIDLVAKLTDAIDENKFTAGIFLDLSKVFDTVNHSGNYNC